MAKKSTDTPDVDEASKAPSEATITQPFQDAAGDGHTEEAKVDDAAVIHDEEKAKAKAEQSNEEAPEAFAKATENPKVESLPMEDSSQRLPFLN